MGWKDVKISKKLSIGFGFLIFLIVIVVEVLYYGMSTVMQKVEIFDDANSFIDYTSKLVDTEKDYLLSSDEGYVREADRLLAMFHERIVETEKKLKSEEEKESLLIMDEAANVWMRSFTHYKDFQKENLELMSQLDSIEKELEKTLDEMAKRIVGPASARAVKRRDFVEIARWSGIESAMNGVKTETLQIQLELIDYFLNRSVERWMKLEASMKTLIESMEKWGASLGGVPGLKEAVFAITRLLGQYQEGTQQLYSNIQEQGWEEKNMLSSAERIEGLAKEMESQSRSEMAQAQQSAVLVGLGGALLAVIIGVVITVVTTRVIKKPLSSGVSFAQAIGSGDFTQIMPVVQKDEIGILAYSLNSMREKLTEMISKVRDLSEEVTSSSEEISKSAQHLAEGAQDQASMLEETAASVEELASSVMQIADHAQSQTSAVEQSMASMKEVQGFFHEINHTLMNVSDLSEDSVDKSREGADAVSSVVEVVNSFAESSQKIGGILAIISDITDQTNLLALNASIEAARAGEQGRGFTVVADEISKLAERSAVSTKEIEGLIKESIKNVSRGVEIARTSKAYMERITQGSQEAYAMIERLSTVMEQQINAVEGAVRALENINEMSQSIEGATREQKTNAQQVSKAVESVNEVTQQAASAAEEMFSTTEQLAGMAQQLMELVAQFKISEEYYEEESPPSTSSDAQGLLEED